VLLVHNEIHYVPIGDGWEEVLVRNVLHYVPVLLSTGTALSVLSASLGGKIFNIFDSILKFSSKK
jgi:hypothetical protein